MKSKLCPSVYSVDDAYAELRLATGFRSAARAAKAFEAKPALVLLYRSWMRHHAKLAITTARAAKVA